MSRGISVVGGQDVTIQGNTVARTGCCAGIYLASEEFWDTQSVRNVIVRQNLLIDNSGPTWHGAIMVFANRGSVRAVRVEHNTIVNSRHAGIRLLGDVGEVAILDNALTSPAGEGIDITGTNVFCAGNTLDGLPVAPAACGTQRGKAVVTGSYLRSGLNPALCETCDGAAHQ